MNCPHCASATTKEQTQKTTLGYRVFRCPACKHLFNERTGTPFNFLEYPTDVILLVVLWRLRYKLSLRDLAEMFLKRGFVFTHEAVRVILNRFWRIKGEKFLNYISGFCQYFCYGEAFATCLAYRYRMAFVTARRSFRAPVASMDVQFPDCFH